MSPSVPAVMTTRQYCIPVSWPGALLDIKLSWGTQNHPPPHSHITQWFLKAECEIVLGHVPQ